MRLSEPTKRILYELEADWPEDRKQVGQELESLPWQYNISGFEHRAQVRTHEYDFKTKPLLGQIVDDIKKNQASMFETLWANPEFSQGIWPGTTLKQLQNNVDFIVEFNRDDPGWRTGVHIDHRAGVAIGMLFFEQTNDKNMSTYFYTTERRDNEQRMSCEYGRGWLAANTHASWHTGGNMSRESRYSVSFSWFLRLK